MTLTVVDKFKVSKIRRAVRKAQTKKKKKNRRMLTKTVTMRIERR